MSEFNKLRPTPDRLSLLSMSKVKRLGKWAFADIAKKRLNCLMMEVHGSASTHGFCLEESTLPQVY